MKKFVLLCAISLAVAGVSRADSGAVIAQAPVITGGQGTVTKDKVNVRARGDKNAELVAQLTKDERVEVLDTKGDWLKITLPASAKCYVATKFIKDGVTTGDAINIRCGPGTNFKDIGKLAKGERVEVVEAKGEWTQISRPPTAPAGSRKSLLISLSRPRFPLQFRPAKSSRLRPACRPSFPRR